MFQYERMSIDLRMPQLEQIHFTINTNVSNPHFLGDTVKKRGWVALALRYSMPYICIYHTL